MTEVLICDGYSENSTDIFNRLRSHGMYTYTRKKDCNVILDFIINRNPDVVVIDMILNNGDAVSVMNKLRNRNAKMPVFIVTAECSNELLERQVIRYGAYTVLFRPYSADDLYTAVTSALAKR